MNESKDLSKCPLPGVLKNPIYSGWPWSQICECENQQEINYTDCPILEYLTPTRQYTTFTILQLPGFTVRLDIWKVVFLYFSLDSDKITTTKYYHQYQKLTFSRQVPKFLVFCCHKTFRSQHFTKMVQFQNISPTWENVILMHICCQLQREKFTLYITPNLAGQVRYHFYLLQ